MSLLLLIGLFLILTFGAVVLIGAPYLPSFHNQIEKAFDLLELKPGQVLIDLGAGDGKVLLAAAKRGIKSVGYEVNPLLFVVAYLRTYKYRHLVRLKLANYMQQQLPACDGIFIFGHSNFMSQVGAKLNQEVKGTKLVSSIFPLPNNKAISQINGLYLYQL